MSKKLTRKEVEAIVAKARARTVRPTLRKLNLRQANLSELDLRDVDFRYSDLRGTNFQKSDLRRASFGSSKLTGANFLMAELVDADFSHARLIDADFRGANLRDANVHRALLRGANIRSACLDYVGWPIWQGTENVKVDARFFRRMVRYLLDIDVDDDGCKAVQVMLRDNLERSRRAQDLGLMEVSNEQAK